MESQSELRAQIKELLITKSGLKQQIFDNTNALFNELKEALHEFSTEIDEELDERLDKRIRIEYNDRGKFEAQVQIAGDILVFVMHTNVFNFERNHPIWHNPYVQAERKNSYCGVINIYNFLADTIKSKREEDEGYLIGRIFVNREGKFFVEGKRQDRWRVEEFGKESVSRGAILEILERAMLYALSFDLLVPAYDTVKQVSAEQFLSRQEGTKLRTGKRLGYEFRSDDV
ncbi:MAG: hypothetical protein J6V28_03185 [Tidjanibacter sp.]|nr:hypothetical protein [Tidjanibacter sp.]MBQ2247825.1 hypothetical protein [Tidjanibacter sp.]